MRYSELPPDEILHHFEREGHYPVAFPVFWDHEEAVVCRSVPLSDAARTLAEHPNGTVRAIWALHAIKNCKAEAAKLATRHGVHLAL